MLAALVLSASRAGAADPVAICRSADFWGSRAGQEHGRSNVTQAVVDAAGGLEVCGQKITKTTRPEAPFVEGLGLSSAVEGLCVRIRGERERQLYRQLVATALNCALSEADGPGDCDELVRRFVDVDFSDCDSLCAAGASQASPDISRCITGLRCFNVGGRIVAGGRCALGTCAVRHDLFCDADFDACPDVDAHHQSCRRFAGNCHKPDLCQSDIGVCPANERASSNMACEEAALDSCTIDSCP